MARKQKTNSLIQKRKRKRQQNKRRYGMEKPVFRRIFLKRLALILGQGFLITFIGTQIGLHFYQEYKLTSFDATQQSVRTMLQDTYYKNMEAIDAQEEGESGLRPMRNDNYTLSFEQQEQSFKQFKNVAHFNFLAKNTGQNYSYYFSLYDRNTEEFVIDTEKAVFVIRPSMNHAFYECPIELMQEAIQDYDSLIGDDNIGGLDMDDMYVKDASFLPGTMKLVESYDTIIKEYDFTPKDIAGYEYVKLGVNAAGREEITGPIWWDVGGNPKAKAALQGFMAEQIFKETNDLGDFTATVTYGTVAVECVSVDTLSLGDRQFYFATAAHFNMFEEYGWQMVLIYTGIALTMLILAFVLSYRTYMVEQGHFQMEQYRQQTASAMAHDLKTPLTAISGYAESLRDNVHPEKKDYYADAIFENVQHMNQLVENILELAKVEDANRKPELVEVDLRKVTENILKKYEILTADKKLEFDIEGAAMMRADADMMARAIENLISNVVKYALEDTVVHIAISAEGYEIRNAIKGELDVSTEELWKPFVKGSNSRTETQGTGIGLTIVKNIADLHGFTFTLACEEEEFVAKILT